MSDISAFVRRGTETADRRDINKLLSLITPIAFAEAEDQGVRERIELGNNKRIKSTTVTAGFPDVLATENRDRLAGEGLESLAPTWQMPSACTTYPHTHTTTGSLVYEKTTATKFGAGAIFDATQRIDVDYISGSQLDLEITDAFSIAFWMKNTVGSFHGIFGNRAGFVATNTGYHIAIEFLGDIRFHLDNGTTRYQLSSSTGFDDGVYHSVVCTYSGNSNTNGMKIYIDGSLDATGGSLAITGSIKNTNPVTVGSYTAGFGAYPGTLAWPMIFKEELSAAWVTAFNLGFYDWSGGNLIFSIPFTGDEEEWTEATTPFCVSS